MRSFVVCLLAILWMWTDVRASETDEKAFRYVIASYLHDHPLQYPADLLDLHSEGRARLTLSLDRDGRLLDAKITVGSGSAKADQAVLDWLRRLQPFPAIPSDTPAPFDFSEEIVFVPTNLVSAVKIRWVIDPSAAAKQAAFRDQIASHLQHHPRTYTEEMKGWRGKRRAVVALSIDRSGKLLNVEVIRALGSQAIDQETLAWLSAAQPYPQIPADLQAPLKLTAELEFGPPQKVSDGLWNDDKIKRALGNVCKGC